jgi:hypothetical protein
MCAPSFVAARVAAVARSALLVGGGGGSSAASSAPLLVLLTRTDETARHFADCQCELLAAGVLGGSELAPGASGDPPRVSVVSVADDDDAAAWLATLVEGDEHASKMGHRRTNHAALALGDATKKSWDDLAVHGLEKAVGGMGAASARKLLREFGSLKAVRPKQRLTWCSSCGHCVCCKAPPLITPPPHTLWSVRAGLEREASRPARARVFFQSGGGIAILHGPAPLIKI